MTVRPGSGRRRGARAALFAGCLLALGGCVRGCASERPPLHLNPNMDDQPRATALQASDFFYDGKTMRDPLPGTVAREDAVAPGALETGRETADGPFVTAVPAAAAEAFTEPLAVRGAGRYGIYCAPCHGDRGDGQGMLFQRASVASADLRSARLRALPDGQLFDVVTHGLGLMPPYAAQLPPADRWAVVAYMRQLQAESPVTLADEVAAAPGGAQGADPGAAGAADDPAAADPAPAVAPATPEGSR